MPKAKVKKVKRKTHKGTVKVLNVRQSGSIQIGHAGGRHNTGKLSAKTSRQRKTLQQLSPAYQKKLKSVI